MSPGHAVALPVVLEDGEPAGAVPAESDPRPDHHLARTAALENALGKKAKVNRLPEQPGDVPLTCADISKARKSLGYNPKTRLAVGLPKFVEWFQSTR